MCVCFVCVSTSFLDRRRRRRVKSLDGFSRQTRTLLGRISKGQESHTDVIMIVYGPEIELIKSEISLWDGALLAGYQDAGIAKFVFN